MCRDDSLYLNIQAGLWLRGDYYSYDSGYFILPFWARAGEKASAKTRNKAACSSMVDGSELFSGADCQICQENWAMEKNEIYYTVSIKTK